MKIYYTGADAYNEMQKDKDKSLGGFKSSTTVPNDMMVNLFGDISMYGLDKGLPETRGLVVHNDSPDPLDNLSIYFEKDPETLGLYEVAAVELVPDASGEVYMEEIDNIRATPYIGEFSEADTEPNKQLLSASFLPDTYIGLWIRRKLDPVTDKEQFSCNNLWDKYKQESKLVTTGKLNIIFVWD